MKRAALVEQKAPPNGGAFIDFIVSYCFACIILSCMRGVSWNGEAMPAIAALP